MKRYSQVVGTTASALLAIATLTGCADADSGDAISGAAGWSINPEPLVTIGVLDGAPEYVFSRIMGVRLLNDGRLVVADGASGTVRVYRPDGQHQSSMGAPGAGPGEFAYLSSIRVAGGDTVEAYDSRAMRLTTFLSTGELLTTQPFERADGIPEMYIGPYGGGGHAFGWIKTTPIVADRLVFDSMRIGRFTTDGSPAGVLATPTGMRRIGSPVPLSPHLLTGMVGDSVVFTDGLDGIVNVVGPDGGMVRTLQLEGAGWTFDDGMRRVEEHLDSANLVRFATVKDFPGIDFVPDFSDMLIDDIGQIWLKLYEPATDSHWLSRRRTGGEWIVTDTGGRPIARVTMPTDFRPIDIRGDQIAGVLRDDLDVERVRVYRLERR